MKASDIIDLILELQFNSDRGLIGAQLDDEVNEAIKTIKEKIKD